MTQIGAGGVVIRKVKRLARFKTDYAKLPPEIQVKASKKLADLLRNPRPPGLVFEKLKGYANPAVFTIHITGNYKVSMLIDGDTAILRRIAPHDEIDRAP